MENTHISCGRHGISCGEPPVDDHILWRYPVEDTFPSYILWRTYPVEDGHPQDIRMSSTGPYILWRTPVITPGDLRDRVVKRCDRVVTLSQRQLCCSAVFHSVTVFSTLSRRFFTLSQFFQSTLSQCTFLPHNAVTVQSTLSQCNLRCHTVNAVVASITTLSECKISLLW